jgi:hypothetical protein
MVELILPSNKTQKELEVNPPSSFFFILVILNSDILSDVASHPQSCYSKIPWYILTV